jgi:hypothetical protein
MSLLAPGLQMSATTLAAVVCAAALRLPISEVAMASGFDPHGLDHKPL